MPRLIHCNYRQEDCFANIHGQCECLQEHVYDKPNCPFYKSKEDYKKQLEVLEKMRLLNGASL